MTPMTPNRFSRFLPIREAMHFKIKKRVGGIGWAVYRWEEGRVRYVPQAGWPTGLTPEMTLEQARGVTKSLTAKAHIVAEEAKRARTVHRVLTDSERLCAWLPIDIVSHFERVYINPKSSRPGYQKLVSMWKLARRLIVDVNMDPGDWPDEPLPLYDWFVSHPRSEDYVRRVFRLLNKYGRLYCKKRGLAYEPMDLPPDEVMIQISTAFKKDRKSEPLRLEHLATLKNKLTEEELRWVRVAFAFGLRPEEVDLLVRCEPGQRLGSWWLEPGVLVCDQPKLRKIKPTKRKKRIPAVTGLQKAVLLEIRSRMEMKRPSRKRVENLFPEGVTLYGCRHGFTHHMQSLKYKLSQVSAWLGHRSLATTQRYYQDHELLVEGDEAA